ncbi:short-chain fatty acyl-CoA regulator family protein [Bosea sp. (in: a-proteobacteria)]|uniref:helix-turn-helix domain-containing protein n=1 Tax=Bosea sp. (in: a-proteobacteria) TaxID=1871050 RepID=UPI002630D6DD|nr:short-chain fatty acyl-CoA regulator family protein [Bosea sp. (in: a-proteobacteria)]MCO5091378.1 short-chain fatty acyl-CoA regulator family protein [Bosea sp. (in: a-proteobacteria)]
MQQSNVQIGGRIKRLRRQRKISQAALAEALGISPSYLNLIEHNRRRMTVPLLFKAASYFGVEPGEFAESEEPRLAGDLMELFGDDLFVDCDLTNQDISDLATSNPAVGRAVMRLYDRYRSLNTVANPVSAQIEAGDSVTTDAVSDFLQQNANYFAVLEAAAERIRADIDHASDSFEHGLRTYLHNVFGLQWRLAALPPGKTRKVDADRGEILTADLLPAETAAFTVAQHLGRISAGSAIQQLIVAASLPEEAQPVARNALTAYFAAALMMPYEPFLQACKETRYDIERIGRRFRASFEQVCHRMTTLQRPGRSGVPLHLVRTDIAGNISKRFSLSGIHIPRHSGACPRWNVYGAFLNPDRINAQVSQMPDGQRFFCIAKAVTKGGYRHNEPKRHLSIGLGCHVSFAGELVYSDGVDVSNMELAVAIGVGCRICPRAGCAQRAHPAAGHRMAIDDSERSENFYANT